MRDLERTIMERRTVGLNRAELEGLRKTVEDLYIDNILREMNGENIFGFTQKALEAQLANIDILLASMPE